MSLVLMVMWVQRGGILLETKEKVSTPEACVPLSRQTVARDCGHHFAEAIQLGERGVKIRRNA